MERKFGLQSGDNYGEPNKSRALIHTGGLGNDSNFREKAMDLS